MFVGVVAAQTAKTSAIMGAVFDASRTPIAGANVEVVSDATGDQTRATSTDADGKFLFGDLPSGTYTLTVSGAEYQTFKRAGISLAPGMNTVQTVYLTPR